MMPAFATPVPVLLPPQQHGIINRRANYPRSSAANFPFRDLKRMQVTTPQVNHVDRPNFLPQPVASVRKIQLLASDLDGTLLTSKKIIHHANVAILLEAIENGLIFVPATGKSRSGAIRAMGALGQYLVEQHNDRFPGIYLNGLQVFGKGGAVIYEQALSKPAAWKILQEADERQLVTLFYSGDCIFVRERNEHTDMFIISHEPVPTPVGRLLPAVEANTIHKALLIDPSGDVRRHRPSLELAFAGIADITQARPDVLEVLPPGASKGEGFDRLLVDLGVAKENSLAIGDGENDLEMIRRAGLGVAVANSVPDMLAIADEVVCANNEGAVAEAVRRFVL